MKQVFLFILILMLPAFLSAQKTDTAVVKTDSALIKKDSLAIALPPKQPDTSVIAALHYNTILNSTGKAIAINEKERKQNNDDGYFYLLAAVVFLLACCRFFFARYFTNLLRVFFNTSLRQSQLTDQLLQAKLPSLLFNIFFILTAGLYVYFLLLHYHWITDAHKWLLIAGCVGLTALTYTIKFCTLKFTGWITGYSEATNTYVFIVFLINKIIGIFLIPIVIIIAFSDAPVASLAVILSLLCIGLMLLLRFFRSYGLLQHQLKVSRLHFFLYIIGVEIMPLLLIYKALMLLLNKNL